MLMALGQMVAILTLALFTGAWFLDWLEVRMPEDVKFPSAEAAGYMDDPPEYKWKPWHKYTGSVLFALTSLIVWLCLVYG